MGLSDLKDIKSNDAILENRKYVVIPGKIPLQDIALAKHCKGFLKTDAPTENMKTMFCLAV